MAAKKTKKTRPRRGPTEETKRTRDQILRDNAWKPGESGNPAGRPPNPLSMTAETKRVGKLPAPKKVLDELRTYWPDLPDETTLLEALVRRNWLRATDQKGGDVMAKEILERYDGKVPFPVSGPGEGPIEVQYDFSKLNAKQLDELEQILQRCQMES